MLSTDLPATLLTLARTQPTDISIIDVTNAPNDEQGQRHTVDLEILGIEEQREIVRTGWIVEPESDVARLVTLFVRRQG